MLPGGGGRGATAGQAMKASGLKTPGSDHASDRLVPLTLADVPVLSPPLPPPEAAAPGGGGASHEVL